MEESELRSVELFEGLSDSDLKRLVEQMHEVRHRRGAEIAVLGSQGVGFMVILEGEATVSTPDGGRRTLGTGDYFGEMALLDQEGRSATITAATDLRIAAITEWTFKPFLLEHPEI